MDETTQSEIKSAKCEIQENEKEAANKGKKSKQTKALNTAKHADA